MGNRMLEHVVLSFIVGLYLALGVVYSVVTPVFEAPDESAHFFVVRHIVEERSLPIQRADARDRWAQEGSQPPLYYLFGALMVWWIDLDDAEDLLWRNPQANLGDPLVPGNKNVYVHPPEQDFPWHGAVLAVHVLRFFSLLLGAGTVIGIWAVVRLATGRSAVALAAAGVTAFIPQFLFITAAVNNDNAMTCLGTWTLYLLLRRLREGTREVDRRAWLPVGGVLGLALLSKLSALALLPLVGMVIALTAWHRRSWRYLWEASLVVGGLAVAMAGWWYVRNLVLYGEPTGLSAMWRVVGRREDFGRDLWGEFRGLRYSFWGLFGWFSIPMSAWVYGVLDALSSLAVLGGAFEVVRWVRLGLGRGAWAALRYREPEWGAAYRPLSLALLAAWAVTVLVALVRWTSLTPGSQGRLLYPAIAPLVLGMVMGMRAWFQRWGNVRDVVGASLAVGMLALGASAPWVWIAPEYARPPVVDRLPMGAVPLNFCFDGAVNLRGVRFTQEVVHPGEPLKVSLYWEATRRLDDAEEVMVWTRLIGEGMSPTGEVGWKVGVEDAYPGSGTFPLSLWPLGRLIAGRQYVMVGDDVPAPLLARVNVALYRASEERELLPWGGPDLPVVGRVKVVPRQWPQVDRGEVLARLDAGVPDSVELATASWPGSVRAGGTLTLTLVWRVARAPGRDYTVFAHLEDDAGRVEGYGDGPPRRGNYPVWAWAAGEVVVDERLVRVADGAPPGRYHLRVGLYDAGGRVVARRPDGGRWAGDAVELGVVEVR